MSIYLGNLTIDQMENRSGIEWPSDLKKFLNTCHQSKAEDVQPGKWHCFDIPFFLVCGDMPTAQRIYDYLAPISASFKEQMQIGIQS